MAAFNVFTILLTIMLLLNVIHTSKYIFVEQDVDWDEASSYCQNTHGTSLASIHSLTDNEEVSGLCQSSCPSCTTNVDHGCYIGLNDKGNERGDSPDGWVWTDGSTFNWENWRGSGSEPNGDGGTDRDCVYIYPSNHPNVDYRATWADVKCSHTAYFICNHPDPQTTTESPSLHPAPAPNPTKRPTPVPTKRPSTAGPTKGPTAKPTTPSPTQPGAIACGASTVGRYSNAGDQLIFEVSMPFTGELIFDASASNFAIIDIEAFTPMGSYLGSDLNKDGIVSLNPAIVADYRFILVGEGTGVYHVEIRCVLPTQSPTKYAADPTKRPSYAPVNHPITPHPTRAPTGEPSVSPVTSKPTAVIPTVLPTKRPTPLVITSTAQSAEVTDTADSNDQAREDEDQDNQLQGDDGLSDVQIALYVVSSFIICCMCLCAMFVFYKYCLGDMKKMMEQVQHVNSGDWTVPQAEIDFDRDLVVQWLTHTVKLPQYTAAFLNQGYETMLAIQAIRSREELAACGIQKEGHQMLILAEIAALQGTEFNTRRGPTHGEPNDSNVNNAFGGQLPPAPMMGGTNWGNDRNNTYYEVDGEGGLVGHGKRDSWGEDVNEPIYVGANEVPPGAHVAPVLETPMAPPPPQVRLAANVEPVYSDDEYVVTVEEND